MAHAVESDSPRPGEGDEPTPILRIDPALERIAATRAKRDSVAVESA